MRYRTKDSQYLNENNPIPYGISDTPTPEPLEVGEAVESDMRSGVVGDVDVARRGAGVAGDMDCEGVGMVELQGAADNTVRAVDFLPTAVRLDERSQRLVWRELAGAEFAVRLLGYVRSAAL